MKKRTGSLLCMLAIFTYVAHTQPPRQAESIETSSRSLLLSRAEYLDRVQAIWTAQMIAQLTGVRFEHQPASTLPVTPMTPFAWLRAGGR